MRLYWELFGMESPALPIRLSTLRSTDRGHAIEPAIPQYLRSPHCVSCTLHGEEHGLCDLGAVTRERIADLSKELHLF